MMRYEDMRHWNPPHNIYSRKYYFQTFFYESRFHACLDFNYTHCKFKNSLFTFLLFKRSTLSENTVACEKNYDKVHED